LNAETTEQVPVAPGLSAKDKLDKMLNHHLGT